MRKIIYPLVVITLVLTCGCCKTSKNNTKSGKYPLVNTKWMLVAIEGEEISTDYALRPFIQFDTANNITGNLGCNTMFGTYSINKKHKMTVGDINSTKRLCQQMTVERMFTKALRREINHYEIKDDQLILSSDNEEILRFKGVNTDEVE